MAEPNKPMTWYSDKTVQAILFFVVTTFLLSGVLDYPIFSSTILSDSDWGNRAVMWVPGIVGIATALMFRFPMGETLGLRVGEKRYLAFGVLMPIALISLAYGLTFAFGGCGLDFSRALPLKVLMIKLLSGLFNVTGEEIGWRGFLFPALRQRISFRSTCLISGAIWSVWHLPAMIFGHYNNGSLHWYSFVNFTVMVVGHTFLISWVREKSGSILPAIIFHAAHNFFLQKILDPLVVENPYTKFLVSEWGASVPAVLFVVVVLLWQRWPGLASGEEYKAANP